MFSRSFVMGCALVLAVSGPICNSPLLAADSQLVIGSPNVAVADPPVPRPATTPCIVPLLHNESFGDRGANTRMDATPHPFAYRPPADCKGPWAKVVLEADFSVQPGHQYDRTASIWLDGVNLYFGTTEEPSPQVGPSWKIAKDLTDYSSLFNSSHTGSMMINNWIDEKRASLIYASARLLFYPAGKQVPGAQAPDAVYPLLGPGNGVANLNTGDDKLSRTLTLPHNIERAYLDIFPQGQFHDEFWYTCLPDKYVEQTTAFAMRRGYAGAPVHPRACNGGNFREVAVSIDGQPAGLAPIYPWIFTGGINPYLWRPTPGVQTLNFIPYRLDLTPFAGMLSDGSPHELAVRVIGANQYFSVTAALLVYEDPRSGQIHGAVTRNTLAGQTVPPTITSTLGGASNQVNGDVLTKQQQQYVIEGYIQTSHGRAITRVEQSLSYSDKQTFSTIDDRTTRQITDVLIEATGSSRTMFGRGLGSRLGRESHESLSYPLRVDTLRHAMDGNGYTKAVDLHQAYDKRVEHTIHGQAPYSAHISNQILSYDQAAFDPSHVGVSNSSGQHSSQSFQFSDSSGNCYGTNIKAAEGKLSAASEGQGCPGGKNHLEWFIHPDGSPDSWHP